MYLNAIEHKIVRFQLLSLLSFSLCLSPSLKTGEPTTKNPRSNDFAKVLSLPLVSSRRPIFTEVGWSSVGKYRDSAREFRGKVTEGKGRPRREERQEGRERRFPSRLIVSENLSNRSFCFRFYFLLSNLSGHWFPFVHTARLDFSRSKTCTDFYPISLKREEL